MEPMMVDFVGPTIYVVRVPYASDYRLMADTAFPVLLRHWMEHGAEYWKLDHTIFPHTIPFFKTHT